MSIVGAILVLTLPVAVIIFVVIAIMKSVRKENANEESFQKIIRTMYIYIVMIIFLILLVGSTISLFNSCLQLLLPETSQNINLQSDITRNLTIADVTTNVAMLCISIPIFLYYNKLAKLENKVNIESKEKE